MKKNVTALFLTAVLLLTCTAVVCADDASNGIVGHIYSTDIAAFVNGEPIASYNIGGKTVVIAEDLGDNYGYTYTYSDEKRLLSISSLFQLPQQNHEEIARGQTGQILGDVYKTDIIVTYNGINVTGYNIGGRTAVCIEELGNTNGSVNQTYGYSEYLASYAWNPTEKTISLNSYYDNEDELLGYGVFSRIAFTFADNVIYARPDDDVALSSLSPSVNGIRSESDEGAYSYYYTEEFGEQKYVLSPLYMDIDGNRTEIGTGIAVWSEDAEYDRTYLHINNPDAAKALANSVKTPAKTYDEAMAFLTEKFQLTNQIDNDDYTVLLMKDENGTDLIYAVKKSGGCLLLRKVAEKTIGILFDEYQTNELIVTVYPFTDNHGRLSTLLEAYRLDEWYQFN